MNISRRWLDQYVATDRADDAIAETLTMGGLEVDGIERTGPSLEGVLVGRVERVRPHPNADRLVLCDVALGESENGSSEEPVQIACGAPNVAEGQRVPVAPVGTELMLPSEDGENGGERSPVTIEAVELRGARSEGMICSAHELGVGEDASGILVLDEDARVGAPLAEHLAARGNDPSDTVFDIDLTPNRPDAASHLGVARDLAALTGAELERPAVDLPEEGGETAEAVAVEIEDAEACPRYAAMLVRGAENSESPAWLKARLTAVGLQPRNAVVDVTNFVMHECGQPLHAFDFDTIRDGWVVVRSASDETTLTTLDGAERTVPPGSLLICDAERPVAFAGVMGGADTEVTRETTDVLIESAYFDPSTIRRAATALDLSTDASYRFERGVDRDGQVWAAARAARLIADITGGTVAPGLVDVQPHGPPEPRRIHFRPARANAVLGTDLSSSEMGALLTSVGLEPSGESHSDPGEQFSYVAPTFRPDLTREEDLIEEVARLHGYDRIPAPAHVPLPARPPREGRARRLRRRVRELLAGAGLREIQTNSMLSKPQAERFLAPDGGDDRSENGPGNSGVVETLRPISEAMAALRPRLLPGALDAMRFNQNQGPSAGLRFFEFGRVFRRSERGTTLPGYAEHEALLVALSGPAQAAGWSDDASDPRAADFYDAKGVVEHVLLHLGASGEVDMEPFGAGADPNFAFGLRLTTTEGTPLGVVGKVEEAAAAEFDLEHDVFAAELRWPTLAEVSAPRRARRYEPPRRFPAVERDLAVVVPEAAPAGGVRRTIEEAERTPLLREVRLFDVYAGEGVGDGRKSLAFELRFQAEGRTISGDEVDAEVERLVSLLAEEHDAELRG
ncbi:MAG: phenylalanine--tRNA ligase subunit beta [Bacteroidetes bacterium QS_8_68_15]|nr:MAG: phenylalanine--tRNA ligase subunit beta [Bacteroidetes bacterium QS_8_68_15]